MYRVLRDISDLIIADPILLKTRLNKTRQSRYFQEVGVCPQFLLTMHPGKLDCQGKIHMHDVYNIVLFHNRRPFYISWTLKHMNAHKRILSIVWKSHVWPVFPPDRY